MKRQATTLRQRFPDVPTGSPEDVYAWQQLDPERMVLIDVREPQEQAVSMLPTAIRAETVSELPRLNRDQILVPYCTIGYRMHALPANCGKPGRTCSIWKAEFWRGATLDCRY